MIVERFDVDLRSSSRKRRLWAALKTTTRSKYLQKFRRSLNDTKSTMMITMMYQGSVLLG